MCHKKCRHKSDFDSRGRDKSIRTNTEALQIFAMTLYYRLLSKKYFFLKIIKKTKKVAHACAYGLQSIDMVYINFKDLEGLEVNSQQGADLGFTGKQVIHPNNIETVQRVFSPRKVDFCFANIFSIKLNYCEV